MKHINVNHIQGGHFTQAKDHLICLDWGNGYEN